MSFDGSVNAEKFLSSSDNNNTFDLSLQSADKEIKGKFTPKKESSQKLSEVYNLIGEYKRADRVLECGSILDWSITSDDWKLKHANFCRDRLCPMCNWRRSMKVFSQVSRIMNILEKDYDFVFITLTVKNCSYEDLSKTVDALFSGWRFMYHKNVAFRKVVLGSFRGLEITRNNDIRSKSFGTYHPHIHAILAVKKSYWKKGYLTQDDWTKIWQDSCDLDYTPIVNVKRIKPKMQKVDGIMIGSLASAVAEVAKYAVKDSDYLTGSLDEQCEKVSAFLTSLSRRHLVGLTGCFRKTSKLLALDDMEDGDLVHTDDEEIRSDVAEMIVTYSWKNGIYVRV